MNQKRKTLQKVAGVSAVVAATQSSWTKPLISSVILPAHAQISATLAPAISGISCTFDTTTLQVGSVITMEATFADEDTPIEDLEWGIRNSNSGLITTGVGQFTTTTYTVVDGDIGNLMLELEVFDDTGNSATETLCDHSVLLNPQLEIIAVDPVEILAEDGSPGNDGGVAPATITGSDFDIRDFGGGGSGCFR